MTRLLVWSFTIGLAIMAGGTASGQSYPNKPVRVITSAAGGGTDFAARVIGPGLAASFGQPVIIDNRPSTVHGAIVPKAPADGYTLLIAGESLWVTSLFRKMSYDPVQDFTPITLALSSPNLLVVHPAVAAKSVKELVELARAKKGELNYGSGPSGGSPYLAAEMFKAMAGVSMVPIPHKGTGDMINSLLGGQVQVSFPTITAAAPHVKSGRLRALAVTSIKPSALVPGLPTVAETVPGYQSGGEVVILAPPGVPAAIVSRVNQDAVRFLSTAEAKERLLNAGFDVVASSPEGLAAWIKSEIGRWGKLIKDVGITLE